MDLVQQFIQTDENLLYNLINNINSEEVSKFSNNSLIIFSIFNFSLLTKDEQLFKFSSNKIEETFCGKETFEKPVANIAIYYLIFFVKEVYDKDEDGKGDSSANGKDSRRLVGKFWDLSIFMLLRIASWFLKNYFMNLFEEDGYKLKTETLKKRNLVLSVVDMALGQLPKVSKEALDLFSLEQVQTFIIYLILVFNSERSGKESSRYLKIAFKFFKVPIQILNKWVASDCEVSDEIFESNKRAKRLIVYKDRIFAQLALSIMEKWRSFDSNEPYAQSLVNDVLQLPLIYSNHDIKIESKGEEVFLEQCRLLVSQALNTKSIELREKLKRGLVNICKKYSISFGALLKEAEEGKKPKRLEILMDIWKRVLAQK